MERAIRPDNTLVEVWKYLGTGIDLLKVWFNDIIIRGKMPNKWRDSTLVVISKNKGDVQNCSNYWIRLMPHITKIWVRVIDGRLQSMIKISETQFGFISRRGPTVAIYMIELLMEKYREGQ